MPAPLPVPEPAEGPGGGEEVRGSTDGRLGGTEPDRGLGKPSRGSAESEMVTVWQEEGPVRVSVNDRPFLSSNPSHPAPRSLLSRALARVERVGERDRVKEEREAGREGKEEEKMGTQT